MKKYLGIFLIIWLIGLSLPVQVMAGECTSFTDVKYYTNTLHSDCMVPRGIVGYVYFRNNNSKISYYNATITGAHMNIQTNGSIHIDIYKTHWSGNISRMVYEFIGEMDLIVQPGVGLNTTILLPYLNGHILFGNNSCTCIPYVLLLMTNLENYTIWFGTTSVVYWDVYFVDDYISDTTKTEIIETTEQSINETETPTTTTISKVTVGSVTPSIWTIIIGNVVVGEFVIMAVIGRLIIQKRREINIG